VRWAIRLFLVALMATFCAALGSAAYCVTRENWAGLALSFLLGAAAMFAGQRLADAALGSWEPRGESPDE